jgi:thiamine biosynthesis protein ThiS
MIITLNNQKVALDTKDNSIQDLLMQQKLPLSRTAVKVNNCLIKKADWPTTIIQENDNIQTVVLVSGG